MALVNSFDAWLVLVQLTVLICLIPASIWAYNILLHPLAHFPGPIFWRASRIPYLRAAWAGHFPYAVRKLHEQYGEVVRVAPNELSISSAAAWDGIYTHRGANAHAFPKSELWHGNPGGGPASVHFIIDQQEHSRVRKFLGPAFSEKTVLDQEPILQEYVTLLVEKISERIPAAGVGRTTINVVDWLNFTLFDIIGDLAFGESFGCLEKCEYEDWMSMTSAAVKVMYFTAHLRHYPSRVKALLGWLFGLNIPQDIIQQRMAYRQRTKAKLNRRLASPNARKDIIAQLLKSETRLGGHTGDEVLQNSVLFINAASETTATVLTGAFSHLLQNSQSLSELQREFREVSTLSELSLHTVKHLPYLDAVLREALRMCNPNPIGHMRVTPPAGGKVAGHYVPGNTLITIQPVALAFSEDHFHQADSWHPERWLARDDPSSPFHRDDRKAVRAFGAGYYNCIGEPLGWAWMRLILAKLVWTFDFTNADAINAWDEQEVYATVQKQPLNGSFAQRRA